MIQHIQSWPMSEGAEYLSLLSEERLLLWGVWGYLSLWQGYIEPQLISQTRTTLQRRITSVTVHPDNSVLAVSGDGAIIEWWDLPKLSFLHQSRVQSKTFGSFSNDGGAVKFLPKIDPVVFSSDGRLIGGGHGLFLFLPESAEAKDEFYDEVWDVQVLQIRFHPNETHFCIELAGETSTAIRFGELNSALEVREGRLLKRRASTLSQLVFSFDGKLFAFGDWDLHLYSYPELERIYSFNVRGEQINGEKYQGYVKALWSPPVFLPHAPILICGSPQGILFVWDINTGELMHQVQAHEGQINSLVFEPQNQRLLSAGKDKVVKVWQVAI